MGGTGGAATGGGAGTSGGAGAGNASGPQPPSGWQTVWLDEFDGAGLPDGSKWQVLEWEPGHVNGEAQSYEKREENVRLEGGTLVIEARNDDFAGSAITSGRIMSLESWAPAVDGSASYRVETRAKLAGAKGAWPAFWLLGDEDGPYGGWPNCGEIDIIEYAAGSHYFQSAIHDQHAVNHFQQVFTPANPETEWHTYAAELYADEIVFFVDAASATFPRPEPWSAANWPFQSQDGNTFSIVVNLAMGGGFGGEIDHAALPTRFVLDYVAVYRKD